jgi:L-ascorbate metabolism protein UlaG (beta-lactamase superfamily)
MKPKNSVIISITILLIMLAACGAPKTQLNGPVAEDMTQTNVPNSQLVTSIETTKIVNSDGVVDNNPDGCSTTRTPDAITGVIDNKAQDVRVTYVGNAGFMITTSHKKILIDSLYRGIEGIYTLPVDIQNQLALAQPPFDNIDLILVSHSHRDHFSLGLVTQHLQNDPNAIFASHSSITSQVSKSTDRIVTLDPMPGEPVQADIDGIHVEALALAHGQNGPRNIGFVITVDCVKLFFSGDIDINAFSYEEFRAYNLPEQKIDIAFIPHFYLTNIPSEQQFVMQGIDAKYIIPIHYFYTDPPMNRKLVLSNYPDAIFFDGELSYWDMP